MNKRIAALCLSASCIICSTFATLSTLPSPAHAVDNDNAQKQTADQRLESQVLAAEPIVKDLEQCCQHLLRTTSDLIGEAQRQTLEVVATADDIGPIIMTPLAGVVPLGDYLPCRKKFIDLFMNQLHDVVPMVQQEAGQIELDKEACSGAASDALAAIGALSNKLPDQIAKLDQLTKGPTYDNASIATQAKALQDQVATLRTSCRVLAKELKQEDRTMTRELHQIEKQIQRQHSNELAPEPKSD